MGVIGRPALCLGYHYVIRDLWTDPRVNHHLCAGLLGDQFVGIDPGGSLENLVEGDRLRITQSAIVLEKVIGQFLYGKMSETNSD